MPDKYLETTATYDPFKVQVGGDHYSRFPIQPMEYIEKNKLPFADGCVVKYITRWRFKNGIEDLRKAKHFIEMLISLEEQKIANKESFKNVDPK